MVEFCSYKTKVKKITEASASVGLLLATAVDFILLVKDIRMPTHCDEGLVTIAADGVRSERRLRK